MTKTALIFRGQPAQYAGIGRDIYNRLPFTRDFFEIVRETGRRYSDCDPLKLVFGEGVSPEDLRNVFLAHASIFPTNHALFEYFRRNVPDFHFEAAAGHSLGQVNAFVAAGALSFEDAANLVLSGGQYLHDASNGNSKGALASVMFREGIGINEYLTELNENLRRSGRNEVYIALDNSSNNIVLGGTKEEVEMAVDYLNEKGKPQDNQQGPKKRNIAAGLISQIEGPFHTAYLNGAAEKIKPAVFATHFGDSNVTVYANSTSRSIRYAEQFRGETIDQISMPVRWRNTIDQLNLHGIARFVVIDPGQGDRTIADTIRIPNKEVLVIRDTHSLDEVVASLVA